MGITDEMIAENRLKFIELLNKISRDGANIEGLIAKLDGSDFFHAPASTRFHGSYKGGLCDHCLSVYYNLTSLIKTKHLESDIPEESAIIVGLLHDFSKMNTYTTSVRNKKVYSESGSKYDEMGRYDWVSEKSYATLPEEERFLYGNHEETSEFMVRQYIPLKYEESVAVLHHHGGIGYDSIRDGFASKIMNRYNLAALLHIADMLSAYVDRV